MNDTDNMPNKTAENPAETPTETPAENPAETPAETGGPKGAEPTRYGDWERNGRCSDF